MIRSILARAKENVFPRGYHHGVFQTVAEAEAAMPPRRKQGYDYINPAKYVEQMGELRPSDYPILFWLAPLLPRISRLFDYGGNLGHTYYGLQKVIQYPESFEWIICDVPSVIELGEKTARERNESRLLFTEDFAMASTCEVFFTAGTIQVIEEPLHQRIAGLTRKPRHIFVNRSAIWDGDAFVSLADLGETICPYTVRNRRAFIASMEGLGYELKDSWKCLDSKLRVRRHLDKVLDHFWGFYFRRLPDQGEWS